MDAATKANISLHALLRNLQELCSMDEVALSAIENKNVAVQFFVKGLDAATFIFQNGTCRYSRSPEEKYKLRIAFSSPERFNRLMNGEKVAPSVNFFGLFYSGFIFKTFPVLTERLAYYLRPTDEKLFENEQFFRRNTTLMAYTTFYAFAEIGNGDPDGKSAVSDMGDGCINIEIKNGSTVHLISQFGKLTAYIGKHTTPSAEWIFENPRAANDVLRRKKNTVTAMSERLLTARGKVHQLDAMNRLLAKAEDYL
ncbi:hypothetical protein FACS189454_05220 [Planctomycetales bacterium]|nr:hypothetical protein FACS189454_05220 [Planctomycetales bacterium]